MIRNWTKFVKIVVIFRKEYGTVIKLTWWAVRNSGTGKTTAWGPRTICLNAKKYIILIVIYKTVLGIGNVLMPDPTFCFDANPNPDPTLKVDSGLELR